MYTYPWWEGAYTQGGVYPAYTRMGIAQGTPFRTLGYSPGYTCQDPKVYLSLRLSPKVYLSPKALSQGITTVYTFSQESGYSGNNHF